MSTVIETPEIIGTPESVELRVGTGRAGPGRPKGLPNRYTRAVKEAICDAFENLGGVPALVAWAKENPDEFYKLWGRMAPMQHDITSNGETLASLVAAAFTPPSDN